MKKLKLLVAAMFMAIALGLPAKAVFAATINLTQADFTFADCNGTANAKGIICSEVGGENAYQLPDGEFTLGENISLGTGTAFTTGDSFSLDLNGKTISTNNDTYSALELDGKSAIISGTGNITNTGFGRGVAAYGEYDASDNLVARTKLTINGNPNISSIGVRGTELTINGGTFAGSGWVSAVNFGDDSITVINGGTFSAEGADAVYVFGGSLTVNSGTFTSAGSIGLMLEGQLDSLKITGGTFTGKTAGLVMGFIPTSTSLSGGTFTTTGSDEWDLGPIQVSSDDVTENTLNSFLAVGASYSDGSFHLNSTVTPKQAYLTTKSVTITNGSTPAPADDSTSTDSSSTVGTPNSGRSTAEAGSATSSLAGLIASIALVSLAFLGKKHFAKKSA